MIEHLGLVKKIILPKNKNANAPKPFIFIIFR